MEEVENQTVDGQGSEEERERVIDQPAELVRSEDLGRPAGALTRQGVDALKAQVLLFKEAKLAILAVTNDHDWVDFEGKPYLADSGIQNVADIAPVEFGKPEISEERGQDDGGQYVIYTVKMTGVWKSTGRRHSDIGTASSRDRFFAKKKDEDVPFHRIRLDHVKKKAVTNAQHRILEKLLGLGGLSWEQLEPLGIKPPKGSVRFKGNERKQATGAGQWTREKGQIWGMLLELAAGDEEEAAASLFKRTDNPTKGYKGKREPAELTDGVVRWLLPAVRSEYEREFGQDSVPHEAEAPGGPPPAARAPAAAPAPPRAGSGGFPPGPRQSPAVAGGGRQPGQEG